MQQGNILQSQFARGGHGARADSAECEHSVRVSLSLSLSQLLSHTLRQLLDHFI